MPRPLEASTARGGRPPQDPDPSGPREEIAQPWPIPSTQDRQPTHHHGEQARLASPRPGDPRAGPGARHGPRHPRTVARPLRRIPRRATRRRHLIPIPLAPFREARGIAGGGAATTTRMPTTTRAAGRPAADTTEIAQDLGHLTTMRQILDGTGTVAELADHGNSGGTQVQGRGDIVEPRATWRVRFATPGPTRPGPAPQRACDRSRTHTRPSRDRAT